MSSNETKEEPGKGESDQQRKQISKKNEEHPKPLDPDKQNHAERLPTKVTLEEVEKSEDIKILTDKVYELMRYLPITQVIENLNVGVKMIRAFTNSKNM